MCQGTRHPLMQRSGQHLEVKPGKCVLAPKYFQDKSLLTDWRCVLSQSRTSTMYPTLVTSESDERRSQSACTTLCRRRRRVSEEQRVPFALTLLGAYCIQEIRRACFSRIKSSISSCIIKCTPSPFKMFMFKFRDKVLEFLRIHRKCIHQGSSYSNVLCYMSIKLVKLYRATRQHKAVLWSRPNWPEFGIYKWIR